MLGERVNTGAEKVDRIVYREEWCRKLYHQTRSIAHVGAGTLRLLALLTRVLYACFICSRLFLKFCLKMAECMEFQDYLQAGVHDSVREGTPAASWAKAKMRLTKSLRHLGDSRSQWLQTFASASGFGGTEDALIENLIGYMLTEQVQINMTTGPRPLRKSGYSQKLSTKRRTLPC